MVSTVTKESFVRFGLAPLVLGVVVLGGDGTCAITWDSAVVIVDEQAAVPCPPCMTQRGCETIVEWAPPTTRCYPWCPEPTEYHLPPSWDYLVLSQHPREKRTQHARAAAERRQAEAKSKRREQDAERERLLAEAQRKRQLEQADEQRKRAEMLSGKVDGLLKAVAAAQRENRVLQERAETERRQAETERVRLQQEAEQQRLLAEAQHRRHQKQAEEERQKAQLLSGKVESLLDAVAAVQREKRVLQERAEALRRQKEVQRKPPMDTTVSQIVVPVGGGIGNPWFLVAGGLVLVGAAGWYTARRVRGSAGRAKRKRQEQQVENPPRTAETLRGTVDRSVHRRILLADDGHENRRFISSMLKRAGAEVTLAENGRIAVETALAAKQAGKTFDVILMDMQMPVMDGYEATTLLRDAGYTNPIIALSAHAMGQDRQKCLDASCDDYVSKPMDRENLVASVAKHIGSHPTTGCRNPRRRAR